MAEGNRRTRIRLRTRLTLAFGLGALLVSLLLSAVTYGLTRSILLDRREEDAVSIAIRNAGRMQLLITEDTDEEGVRRLLADRATIAGAVPALRVSFGNELDWISDDSEAFFAPDEINEELLRRLTNEVSPAPAQMRYTVQGQPFLVIGIPDLPRNGIYLEAVPLGDIDDTLRSLSFVLLGASLLTTFAGFGFGIYASRRVLSPLGEVSSTAEALAAGDLGARLDVKGDRDLTALATSFNDMASNLEDRIERDAQFASDVSHELRSPLTTITASVAVLETRREDLSERGQTALDLLSSDIERFRQLVEDLLEISRYDTSGGRFERDYFEVTEFVRHATADAGYDPGLVEPAADMENTIVQADKRRLARVVANLLDNAENYGGGPTLVELRRYDDVVEIAVEDAGPGVPVDERQQIFGRFARGSEGGRRGAGTGTGLGLALVVEHVRLHGGRVRVDDRPDGENGARFVVELPVVTE